MVVDGEGVLRYFLVFLRVSGFEGSTSLKTRNLLEHDETSVGSIEKRCTSGGSDTRGGWQEDKLRDKLENFGEGRLNLPRYLTGHMRDQVQGNMWSDGHNGLVAV